MHEWLSSPFRPGVLQVHWHIVGNGLAVFAVRPRAGHLDVSGGAVVGVLVHAAQDDLLLIAGATHDSKGLDRVLHRLREIFTMERAHQKELCADVPPRGCPGRWLGRHLRPGVVSKPSYNTRRVPLRGGRMTDALEYLGWPTTFFSCVWLWQGVRLYILREMIDICEPTLRHDRLGLEPSFSKNIGSKKGI